MEAYVLVGIAFFTSTLTAITGMGGGIMLISAMPGLLPAAAIIPIHGAVQLASNSSRVLLGIRHIEWRIFWPFSVGAVLGSAASAEAVVCLRFDQLPLYIWVPSSFSSPEFPSPNARSTSQVTSPSWARYRSFSRSSLASPAP